MCEQMKCNDLPSGERCNSIVEYEQYTADQEETRVIAGAQTVLASLYSAIEARLALQQPLAALAGRLDLVLAQLPSGDAVNGTPSHLQPQASFLCYICCCLFSELYRMQQVLLHVISRDRLASNVHGPRSIRHTDVRGHMHIEIGGNTIPQVIPVVFS